MLAVVAVVGVIGITRRLLPFLGSSEELWCALGILLIGRFTFKLFVLLGIWFN